MLVSSGIVGGLNLVYNLAVAHELGASGFGHASAVYTVLMLLSSVHLSFQIVCSKLVATTKNLEAQIAVYRHLLRRAWMGASGVGLALVVSRSLVSSYLNLPTDKYIVILAAAVVFYIPLGVRRGLMQGMCSFRSLAFNFVLEASVKVGGAFLFMAWGWGVSGVIGAVVASDVLAYTFSSPAPTWMTRPRIGLPFPVAFGEGLQASLFFAGQVVINNLDIVLVKHFFSDTEAGVYAAIALVGRVVYMLSWSVVSAMFPFSASVSANKEDGRRVLATALALAAGISALFALGVWAAPAHLWHLLLGAHFPLNQGGSYRALLVLYVATTGIYSVAVVLMAYEISRKIGNVSWVQLLFSGAMIGGIYWIHGSLHDVIMVQTVLLSALLIWVSVPFIRAEVRNRRHSTPGLPGGLTKLRRVTEDEAIAEFLKGEFYQREFDRYREQLSSIVNCPDLTQRTDNRLRRALLYIRRGRLWQEVPDDTEWWEVELQSDDLRRLRVFPRGQWRKHSGRDSSLLGTAERIANLVREPSDPFLEKLRSLRDQFAQSSAPAICGTVLLIGTDERGPLTIIEGNHRITAAALVSAGVAHRRFRFLCGFSPHMVDCCWYNTNLFTLLRYAKNSAIWLFDDYQKIVDEALRNRADGPATHEWDATTVRNTGSLD